jgi:hypothetical protein
VSADTVNVHIQNCGVPDEGAVPQINLNGAAGVVVENVDPGTSVLSQNSGAATAAIIIGNGQITIGGNLVTVS